LDFDEDEMFFNLKFIKKDFKTIFYMLVAAAEKTQT
jgi:hypothetical protein